MWQWLDRNVLIRGGLFWDKHSEKLPQTPRLPVDCKQTLRPCLHSREIESKTLEREFVQQVEVAQSCWNALSPAPVSGLDLSGFLQMTNSKMTSVNKKSFSLQNQSYWRRNAVCPVNVREAVLDVEPPPPPRQMATSRDAPNNQVKSQDCSHFAVFSPFSIMLICSDSVDIIENQISLEMKKLNLDHCGE